MKIDTTYEIDQPVWRVLIQREGKRVQCPACEGRHRVTTTGKDGKEYEARCPNTACDYGTVTLGLLFRADVRRMTVGQVSVRVGGVNGSSNMAGPEKQNRKTIETFMCYETGIGSGSVYTVSDPGEPHPEAPSMMATFGTEEDARAWADKTTATLNAMLAEMERAS